MATSVVRVRHASEVALELIQRHNPDYHPLIALAKMAHDPAVTADPKLEFEIHKSILPYVTPKLSAVEIKQEISEERRVIVSLFEQQQLPDGRMVDVEVPLVTDITDLVKLD